MSHLVFDLRTRCINLHHALTTPGGVWPTEGAPQWKAGTNDAFAQLEDCWRIYVRDTDAAERKARIWAPDDAHYLLHDLCRAMEKCPLYGNGERVRHFARMLASMRRPHRLFHDTSEGQHYLSCVLHGRQFMVTAERAEQRHAAGEPCPRCERNIASQGYRR